MSIPESLAASLAHRYRIERQAGQGGMASVYLAKDLKHGRNVAIKVLRPWSAPDSYVRSTPWRGLRIRTSFRSSTRGKRGISCIT